MYFLSLDTFLTACKYFNILNLKRRDGSLLLLPSAFFKYLIEFSCIVPWCGSFYITGNIRPVGFFFSSCWFVTFFSKHFVCGGLLVGHFFFLGREFDCLFWDPFLGFTLDKPKYVWGSFIDVVLKFASFLLNLYLGAVGALISRGCLLGVILKDNESVWEFKDKRSLVLIYFQLQHVYFLVRHSSLPWAKSVL